MAKRLYMDFWAHRESIKWTVEIHEDGYGGAASVMTLGPVPFRLSSGGEQDLFDPHRGSECDIDIVVLPGNDYSFLYTTNSRKFLVKIYKYILSSSLYWTGYLIPGQITDSFKYSRILTVSASDGLGLLKDQPYVDTATGLPYDGFASKITVIARCLLNTGLALNIRSLINLVPSGLIPMPDADDTLNEVFVQQTRLQDAQLNPVSCLDAICEILRPLGATIRQSIGVWYIQRVAELADATVKYREFNSTGAAIGFGTTTLIKQTTEPDGANLLRQMSDLTIESKRCFRSIKTIQDFGLRKSIFPGWDFPLNEYDPVAGTFRHYTKSALTDWTPYRIGDKWIIKCLTDDEPDHYIETNAIEVGAQTGTTNLKLILRGGLSSGIPVSQKVRVYLHIFTGSSYYYWNGSAWTSTYDADLWQMTIPTASVESPEEWEFDIDPFPVDGNMKIRFYDADNLFYLTSIVLRIREDDLNYATNVDNVEVDSDNTESLEPVQMLFNDGFDLDNVSAFYDGIMRSGGATPASPETSEWRLRDVAGSTYRLRKWIAQGYIDNNQGTELSGSFIGQFDFHQIVQLTIFGNKKYMPSYVVLNPKAMIVSGTFLEVQPGSTTINLVDVYDDPTDVANIKTGVDTVAYSATVGGGGGSTVINFTDYRLAVVSLTAGNNPVSFSYAFPSGTNFEVVILKLLTTGGETTGGTISGKNETGFNIYVDYDSSLTYLAMKNL